MDGTFAKHFSSELSIYYQIVSKSQVSFQNDL